jgi:[ribosomal protein S18]-alanine N-acetyltransferase
MTSPSIRLRPATLADVDGVVAIEREAFSDPWSTKSFRDLVGRPDVIFDVAVIAAESGREDVVGFVIVYLIDFEADLANLAVASPMRRMGGGRLLLRHALSSARVRGVQVIFLEVRASNDAARTLYESEGFVEVGRRAKYYVRPEEDALILRKELA